MSAVWKNQVGSDPYRVAEDGRGNALLAAGSSVPSGVPGYAKGGLFLDTTNGSVYTNEGTVASATFVVFQAFAQGAALTAAKPAFTIADAEGTPDEAIQAVTSTTPFGFVNAAELITFLYKVQNLHVRVGEIEARLEAAGIVAAN